MTTLPVVADIAPIFADLDAITAALASAGREDLVPRAHAVGLALSSMLIRTELAIGEAQAAVRGAEHFRQCAQFWMDEIIEEKQQRFAANGGLDGGASC